MKDLYYEIQDAVKNSLKEFFYQIPEIKISHLEDSYIVTFSLPADDVRMFSPSRVRKALSQFGKVSQSRFKHPKLTSGYTEFRYDIIPTIEENVHMTLQDYIIESMNSVDVASLQYLHESFNYTKAEKALTTAIKNVGGEAFDAIDPDSTSYRFSKISRKSLISKLTAELENMGYQVDSGNVGLQVYDKQNSGCLQVDIGKDYDNTEKGFIFYIISVYYVY